MYTCAEPRSATRNGSDTRSGGSRMDGVIEQMLSDMEFFLLRDGTINREQLAPGEFVPDPHEIFPARVLTPSRPNHVLLLNYYMGTGKTHSAAQVLVPMTERAMFIEKSLRENALATGAPLSEIPIVPKPLIVGNWSTVDAFMTELTRPMFGIVSQDEYEHLMELKEQGKSISDSMRDQESPEGFGVASTGRDEYDRIMYDITKRINARVSIYGFQRLFNRYFKGATGLVGKDEKVIQAALDNGSVVVEETLCAQLSDTLMIIDEPQTLYSAAGWNSYGFMIDHILQNPRIKRLKVLMLSGTFINSSVSELIYLANLIRPKGTPRLTLDDYLVKERLDAKSGAEQRTEAIIYRPKSEETARKLIDLFDGKVAFYPMPRSKDYPRLEFNGELVSLGRQGSMKWLKLVRCPASSYQWDLYNSSPNGRGEGAIETKGVEVKPEEPTDTFIDTFASPSFGEAEESKEEGVARDIVIPPKEDWIAYDVKPVNGFHDVYTGSFLSYENLPKFGAIPYHFVRYLRDLIGKGEKCCAYHRRVERGGIYQYAQVLQANGFTHLGDNPSSTAMCYFCGEYLSRHARVEVDAMTGGGEVLESSSEPVEAARSTSAAGTITSHPFRPASFAVLTGRQTQLQRQKILDRYNSPANADASRVMCILISSVGEKGMTLLNTNHMVVLDSVPNVSLLKQIVARVARHSTHKGLPEDKQWVKISVMSISPPSRSGRALQGTKEEYSREEFRYFLRELNDKYVGAVWRPIQRNSINCPLLEDTGARAGFGKGDWESGEIVCRYHFPKPDLSSLSKYNAHYYAADVSAAVTVIMHVLNTMSPAVYLSEMERIIRSNAIDRKSVV